MAGPTPETDASSTSVAGCRSAISASVALLKTTYAGTSSAFERSRRHARSDSNTGEDGAAGAFASAPSSPPSAGSDLRSSSGTERRCSLSSQREKAERFVELHRGDPFVIPNPFDVGSARELEKLGFPALTTTSSGFAWTLGKADGEATLDEVVEHVRAVAAGTSVPLAVDLENGYGPPDVAILRVAEAGAVGASIEDWDGARLYSREEAADRVAAAADAARSLDYPFVLVGRAENLLRGVDDLDDTIARLSAYADAGADCLYAPGLCTVEQIRTVCAAVDRPVNVLRLGDLALADIFAAGAQRVSVGGAFTWVARDALVEAAKQLL